MAKLSKNEKRLEAIYKFKDNSNSYQRKELLEFFMATASMKKIAEAIDHFNIKI